MLGALVIARGVSDPDLRREMLAAMRRHILPAVDKAAPGRRRHRRSASRAGGREAARHVG